MAINTSGFGAYDIRGVYPESINGELAYRVGRVFPEIFGAKKVVVGHDIRLSGPTIFDALSRGLTEAGCEVYDIGQCGTEMIYFATGFHDFDGGIMITASHNPKEYNGMKFVGKGVRPVSPKSGLLVVKAAVEDASVCCLTSTLKISSLLKSSSTAATARQVPSSTSWKNSCLLKL